MNRLTEKMGNGKKIILVVCIIVFICSSALLLKTVLTEYNNKKADLVSAFFSRLALKYHLFVQFQFIFVGQGHIWVCVCRAMIYHCRIFLRRCGRSRTPAPTMVVWGCVVLILVCRGDSRIAR